MSVPKGILASQYLDQISAEAAALSGAGGTRRMVDSEYGGDYQKFAQHRARAGMGTGMQKLGSEIGSGNGVMDSISANPSSMSNFMHQAGTAAASGFMAQAAMGKFSKDNKDYDRDAQVKAAQVMANDGLVKSVQTTKGLVDSMAFDKDGNIGKKSEFDEYAKGTSNQSRIAANKVMGAGKEDLTSDNMADVKRTEQANVKALIAKGDALQKSFGSNLDGSLNGQSYDTMIRAQEGGQFSSSTKAIKAAGGEDGFIALQRDTSSMKTGQSMASVKANKDAGFLDNDGNVTALGKKAFAITPGEQANALVGKMNLAKKSQKIVDEVADAAYDAELANSGDKFAANIAANKAIAPFLDGKGNALTGQAFWNKQAELKSGSFSGSNSMMFGDGQVFSGGISLDGKVSGKLSSGLSTSQDNTISLSNGYSIKENLYNPETRASQQSLERAEHALDPKKAAAKIMAAGGKKASELNQFLNENGIPTGLTNEQAFAGGEGAMYAAATAVGGAMLNQSPKLFGAKRSLYEMFDDLSSGRKNAEATHKSSDETKPNNNSESGKPNHSDTPNSDKDSVSKNTKSGKSGYDGFFEKRWKAAGDAFAGSGSWKKKMGLAASAIVLGSANETFANTLDAVDPLSYVIGSPLGEGSDIPGHGVSPAPQHKGFTTLPMGAHTMQGMIQTYNATVDTNTQALQGINPNQAHVGFTMQDADQNPVTFTTDKSSRNMMMNGYDTGMPAQQFSNMVQSPDAVNQFASAISQTSFSGNH